MPHDCGLYESESSGPGWNQNNSRYRSVVHHPTPKPGI